MIQRLQTLYLFLVVLLTALMLMGGFVSYVMLPLAILLVIVMLLSVIGIFLYKKRKPQRNVVLVALILDVAAIVLEVVYVVSSAKSNDNTLLSNYKMVFPVINLIFLWLAARGIKKDEELVKSYDRLR